MCFQNVLLIFEEYIYTRVFINTLCDGAEDNEDRKDPCVRTTASVKGPTSSCFRAFHRVI